MNVGFWLSVMADVKRQHVFLTYLSRHAKKLAKKAAFL